MALIKIAAVLKAVAELRAYPPSGRASGRIIIPKGAPAFVYENGVVRVLTYMYPFKDARFFFHENLFKAPKKFKMEDLIVNQSPVLDASLYEAPKTIVNEPTFISSKKAKAVSKAAERLPSVGDVDVEVTIESKVRDIADDEGGEKEKREELGKEIDIARSKGIEDEDFVEFAKIEKIVDDTKGDSGEKFPVDKEIEVKTVEGAKEDGPEGAPELGAVDIPVGAVDEDSGVVERKIPEVKSVKTHKMPKATKATKAIKTTKKSAKPKTSTKKPAMKLDVEIKSGMKKIKE